MLNYVIAYIATASVMVLLDILWLGFIAKPLYQDGIGHLMAERPNIGVAIAFYLIYAAGLVIFTIAPHGVTNEWSKTIAFGALFGFFCYATYDLSNLATLRNWPWSLTLIDMAWGTAISALSAAAGKAAWDWYVSA